MNTSVVSHSRIVAGVFLVMFVVIVFALAQQIISPPPATKSIRSETPLSVDTHTVAYSPASQSNSTSDPVIAAVGDMVPGTATHCSATTCKQMLVSQLILSMNPMYFFALGDTQYEKGEYSDFLKSMPCGLRINCSENLFSN